MPRFFYLTAMLLTWPVAAWAGDPFPPALDVTFIAEPAPLVQQGSTKLYYEMRITNFAPV